MISAIQSILEVAVLPFTAPSKVFSGQVK